MSSSLNPSSSENVIGQCVKPKCVPERSLSSSVAGLVQDAIPSQHANPQSGPEKVEWVTFDQPDLCDPIWKDYLGSRVGSEPPVVVVLGLVRGFQIWVLLQSGDCYELVSDRSGPVKSVTFLPYPSECFGTTSDLLSSARPLICICDSPNMQHNQYQTLLTIYSLREARKVHEIGFQEPIYGIQASKQALVVALNDEIRVFDTYSFSEQLCIKNCQRDGVPFSVSGSWVIYADREVSNGHKSCGGVIHSDNLPTYTTQVLSAAKNLTSTLQSLGESVTGKSVASANESVQGVLSLVDLSVFRGGEVEGVVGHWVAHGDERIGFVQFSPRVSLMCSSGVSSTVFHVFNVLPHPQSPSLSAVHHLYTLYRGNTPAKVLGMAFSGDIRWVAVTTNHGTTHAFPITPYGGPINYRTHASNKVVNRESRYVKSAGLETLSVTQCASDPPQCHPCWDMSHATVSRMATNPRIPPFPFPHVISHAPLKFHAGLLGSLSSWTPDIHGSMSPKSDSVRRTRVNDHKLDAKFASPRGGNAISPGNRNESGFSSVYVVSGEGELVEHCIQATASIAKPSHESPVHFTTVPVAQWTLNRTRSTVDVRCPLPDEHLLVTASQLAHKRAHVSHVLNSPTHRPDNTTSHWISQVEMVTYCGPHRRLWMGPQFTFRTLAEPSQPTNLVSPSERPDRGKSEPMNIARGLVAVPVVLEASSASLSDRASVTMEVCGSWSDNDYISCDEQEGRLRKSIADAMHDRGPMNNDDHNSTMQRCQE